MTCVGLFLLGLLRFYRFSVSGHSAHFSLAVVKADNVDVAGRLGVSHPAEQRGDTIGPGVDPSLQPFARRGLLWAVNTELWVTPETRGLVLVPLRTTRNKSIRNRNLNLHERFSP